MSGILSALSAVDALFGGLSPTGVTLGPVVLQSIQKPQTLPFGGEQKLVIHKLVGGGRIINAMGRDDMPLAWDGVFEGANANKSILSLDGLRISGQPITMSWDIYSFTVVVQKFVANYARKNWIPYSISCEIVSDKANQPNTATSSLNKLVGDSLGNSITSVTNSINQVAQTASDVVSVAQNEISTVETAIGPVASLFGVDIYSKLQGITNALGTAQGIAGGLSAIANAPSVIAGTITSLQAAGGQIVSTLSSAETTMAGVVSNASSGSGIVASVGDLFSSIGASSTIAGVTNAAGYINTAGGNLVAAAGSPLANALDSTTGPVAYGGVTYGPEFIAPVSSAN